MSRFTALFQIQQQVTNLKFSRAKCKVSQVHCGSLGWCSAASGYPLDANTSPILQWKKFKHWDINSKKDYDQKKKGQETLEHIFSDFKLHDQLSTEFETVDPSKRSARTHEVQHFPPVWPATGNPGKRSWGYESAWESSGRVENEREMKWGRRRHTGHTNI